MFTSNTHSNQGRLNIGHSQRTRANRKPIPVEMVQVIVHTQNLMLGRG